MFVFILNLIKHTNCLFHCQHVNIIVWIELNENAE